MLIVIMSSYFSSEVADMKCKNCGERMEQDCLGEEDGLVTMERLCPGCGWKSKAWYELDDCITSNISWVDEKGESKDGFQ